MDFIIDDLAGPKIIQFLEEHIEDMKSVSPPESKHALDLDGLRNSDVIFWSAWEKGNLLGCGALKELNPRQAEIKSMRVSSIQRGKGVASKLLTHMLDHAVSTGYKVISLEMGSMPYFDPARRLYEKFGFDYCQPFANYAEDPNSVFMSLELHSANQKIEK